MVKKFDRINKVSSESVEKATGKTWDQWIKILETAGAKAWTHKEIVAHLKKKHKLTMWWQQWVATGFGVATGKRIEGQNQKGEYSTIATKSLAINAKNVWSFVTSPEGLAIWLRPLSDFELKKGAQFEVEDGAFGEVRTLLKGVRVRLSWQEIDWPKPTIVQVQVHPKPNEKCILAIQHEQICNTRELERLRERWRSGLDQLADQLTEALKPRAAPKTSRPAPSKKAKSAKARK